MTTLADLLKSLAAGQIPAEVPADCEYREEVRALVDYLADLARFTRAMAAGDLSATIQARGSLAGSLKGLHANLRHLTWQTQQVAGGDFKQRVQFLGEFSAAFNSMVESLAHAREELVAKNYQLATAYQKLKAAQAQLLQQEKMASVGQLAAGMAHEINNPIGFVMSNLGTFRDYSRALKEYIEAADRMLARIPEADRKALEALRGKLDVAYIFEDLPTLLDQTAGGTKRVQEIVQNLKNFAHVDEAEVQQISVKESLESTIKTMATTLSPKITFVRDYGDLPLVECRPQQLSQLFHNLLQNAAQAVGDKGEIRIHTRREGDAAVIVVADSGCGIPREIIGRIFEPFFTTRAVGQGTGLGLSMVYDIVRKHHGKIEVASTVGAGSTFTVRLPLRPPGSAPAAGKPE
jgi:two-component system, NtrC family, sensor kinase